MEELWKDIPGYEGLYQASTYGNIRTSYGKTTSNARYDFRVWKSRILKPKKRKRTNGLYDPRVDLWKNGTHKSLLVSRLIAITWCSGYKDGLTVNHIDGNPLNNKPENLEWISRSENIRKGFECGLYTTQKKVTLRRDGFNYHFMSQSEASRFLHRSEKYICNRIKRSNYMAYATNGDAYEICM